MKRLIGGLAAAALFAGAALAQSERIALDYEEATVTNAQAAQYWSDIIPQLLPDPPREPKIYVADMPTSGGGSFVVTVLSASAWCGLSECPVRIFEDGAMIADFMACSDTGLHELSPDGTRFYGCDLERDISELLPAAE